MIKGVVFDLDGLMIDSEPLALEAWQISLAPFGARLSDAQYRYLIGVSHDTSLRYIADHASIGIPVDEFAAIYHGNLMSLIDSDRLQPMPGLLPLLNAFAARGYVLGIASNSRARAAGHGAHRDRRTVRLYGQRGGGDPRQAGPRCVSGSRSPVGACAGLLPGL